MHEDDKKNVKQTKRHYNDRRKDYVDSFQWGFVDDNSESEGKFDSQVQKTKKTEESRHKNRKVPEKNVPAVPSVSQRQRESVRAPSERDVPEEAGFKMPSYGRTPVPTDEELTLITKKRLDAPVPPLPPQTLREPKKPSVERVAPPKRIQTTEKKRPVAEPDEVRQEARPPFTSDSLTRREKKVQMVWNPDLREYVPLDAASGVSRKEPEMTELPPSKTKEKKVPKSRPAKAVEKTASRTPAAERSAPMRPLSPKTDAPVRDSVPRQEKTVRTPPAPQPSAPVTQQPEPRSPKKTPPRRKERSVTVQRGDVSPLKESNHPNPADIESESKGFAELGVSETMLEALKTIRYLEPTPIQAGVFKQVQAGTDVMGQAQTGTGKTAAFLIPLIEGIEECPPGNDPVALILVPTRELAVQVRDESVRLSYGRDVRTTACYGGKPLAKQIERLRFGIDIVVGTPGRVLDLINRRALSLDVLKWVVLDEADRMLDIGFRPDIEKILRRTPKERQTLLFSATLPPPVVRLAEKYMNAPEILDFSPKGITVDTIEQFYVTVDTERKFDALVHLLQQEEPHQAIIFTRTKRGADRLCRLLSRHLDSISAIHGDLSQDQRDAVMGKFRKGTLRYLVATDVVGRGIDVSGISHIINYDIPAFCDDYVHRVGRTGRMGREGVAYTFVTVQEGSELTRIEMRIDKLLHRAELKGFETFTKPNVEEEASPPPDTKPVYGKPVRRIRRAL